MRNWKILLLTISIVTNTSFAIPKIVDKIAAIVNNGIVLESEIDKVMKFIPLNIEKRDQNLSNKSVLRNQILEHLIMNQVILQIAKKIGIEITDKQLDQAIENIAKRHNMKLKQMQNLLKRENISYSDYRNQIRNEMIISEVQYNEVIHRIRILPQEVTMLAKRMKNNNIFDTKINLNQILIPFPSKLTNNQVAKVERQVNYFIKKLRNSRNFNNFIRTYTSKQKKLKNIYMGWIRIKELPSIFRNALITAKKGDIIGPIRSSTGFHILKVNHLHKKNQNIFITEVHARHILLKSSPIMTDEQACENLKKIANNIKNGKISFVHAAKEFSEDQSSSNHGGDLGWREINNYDPAFRDIIQKLSKGQISAPFHSSIGWHLIELLDTRKVDKTDKEEHNQAYRLLFNHKFSEETNIWMQEQLANAYIKL